MMHIANKNSFWKLFSWHPLGIFTLHVKNIQGCKINVLLYLFITYLTHPVISQGIYGFPPFYYHKYGFCKAKYALLHIPSKINYSLRLAQLLKVLLPSQKTQKSELFSSAKISVKIYNYKI